MIFAFIAALVAGLALLLWSADKFIDGAASIAAELKVSGLIIGLIILGFGTSAPEIIVSMFAALDGTPELALGNALGSNIANICLVLGVSAVFLPVAVGSEAVRKESIILIIITAAIPLLLFDEFLSRQDSIILFAVLIAVLGWMVTNGRGKKHDALKLEVELDPSTHPYKNIPEATMWTVIGLVILLLSSKAVVWGATGIAQKLGVSDFIIGLTIIAIGTSLPELAASMSAALKHKHDMAIGNIIGSNLFNLLAVIGISGIIAPYSIPSIAINRDYTVMALLTFLLFVMVFRLKNKTCVISRAKGGALLGVYLIYLVSLIIYDPEML